MMNLGVYSIREGFAQLLDNPSTGRMSSDIDVHNASPVMADNEKAVEHAERESRDREEIHRGDGFAMIAKKRQPAFGGF
jgi:hypothetical protein